MGLETPDNGSGSENPAPVPEKYPESKKDAMDDSILGFYDYDKLGQTRVLRNDLTGSFLQ
jgi:hypothetical protein